MINGHRELDNAQWDFDGFVIERTDALERVMRKIGQANELRAWYDQLPPEFKSTDVHAAYTQMAQALVHPSIQYDIDYDEHFLHVLMQDGRVLLITEQTVQLYQRKSE